MWCITILVTLQHFFSKGEKLDCCDTAGVMGLMSVWVGGLDKPCTGQFGASAMASMPMPATAAIEHPLKNGE